MKIKTKLTGAVVVLAALATGLGTAVSGAQEHDDDRTTEPAVSVENLQPWQANAEAAGCYVPPDADDEVLAKVYRVALEEKVSSKVLLATFETAWVESHANDLNCGDRDSVGVFQQRRSTGWVNAAKVKAATRDFLHGNPSYNSAGAIQVAKAHPRWTAGQIAQKVQVSGFPDRYDEAESKAKKLIERARTLTSPVWPRLTQGASGHDVRTMKGLLKAAGYDVDPSNGGFGPKTARLVRNFKVDHGLDDNSVMGWRAWRAAVVRLTPPDGDGGAVRSPAVRAVKYQLVKHGYDVNPDRWLYSDRAASFVKDFKRSRGLRSDRTVGINAWKHLLGS